MMDSNYEVQKAVANRYAVSKTLGRDQYHKMHKKHKISTVKSVFDKTGKKDDKNNKSKSKKNDDDEQEGFFMLDVKQDPNWNFSSPIF